MNESNFYIFDKKREAEVYLLQYESGKRKLIKKPNFDFLIQDVYEKSSSVLGGSSLCTTVSDYSKLLNTLIDGYNFNNQKVISSNLLQEMKSDQLTKNNLKLNWNLNEDYSYGFGVRVRIKNENFPLTEVGEIGWNGVLGSIGLVDTKK